MAQAGELQSQAQLYGALRDGLEALDLNQQVTFQAYTRVVLPVDGYVFWSPTTKLVARGSLHYAQDQVQSEDETYGMASVTFTSEDQVTAFSSAGVNTIYVATVNGFRFSFSQQQGFYTQASVWHYFGHSVAPAMASQLLDRPDAIDPSRAVVSNSLPLWLALNGYAPAYMPAGKKTLFTNSIMLYPSFLTEPDIVPPYAAVHIPPESTRGLQSVPFLARDRTHSQLVSEHARITLYGLQSNEALDFVDCVMQYSQDTDNFGIMNVPVISDGKRPQNELNAIAMQKFIDFEISYYQTRSAQLARQLILSAHPKFIIGTI